MRTKKNDLHKKYALKNTDITWEFTAQPAC